MARTSVTLSKTSTQKLEKFYKKNNIDDDEIKEEFHRVVLNDVKQLKECTEKYIIDYYIEFAELLLSEGKEINDTFWIELKGKTRNKLANKYTSGKTFDNNIDIYFNEVKREYILHPQNESSELEFLPENKDIFIKNNLKLVIDCAKRYQNLGLPFEDLIQIGNYGLLIAFDKFDTERANLRFAIIADIDKSENDDFSYNEAEDIIKANFTYSKNLDSTLKKLPEDGFSSKKEFKDWVKVNVKTAVFASVAFQWIRAYILLELNKLGKIIRVPKSAQVELGGSPTIINLDSINPHTDDCYHDNQIAEKANEEFIIEDEAIENMERNNLFKELLNKVMYKLSSLDRRIIKKRYGIEMPYQLSISEIAESEGISTNKVKYSLNQSMKVISENISEHDKQMIIDLL